MRQNEETYIRALVFFMFYMLNMMILVFGNSAVTDFIYGLAPNVSYELHQVASSMIEEKRNGQELSPLPDGYSIDVSKSTQRVFCLRHKYGAWAKYSWSGSHTALESSNGWLFKVTPFIFLLGVPLILTAISMPLKFMKKNYEKFVDFITQ